MRNEFLKIVLSAMHHKKLNVNEKAEINLTYLVIVIKKFLDNEAENLILSIDNTIQALFELFDLIYIYIKIYIM